MKRITKYASMLLLGATLVGCATSAITGRKYLKLVDSQTINNQAALAYKDFLSKNSSKVETGSAAATQVKRHGRICRLQALHRDLERWRWPNGLLRGRR